jgi:DNA-binding SARP family transcriptional activator
MRLQLSNAPHVIGTDDAVCPLAPRDAVLLAWLALEGPTPRTRLAALLWPQSTPESAANALRQRLFQLRRQLGVELVSGHATLSLAAGVEHDLMDSRRVLGDSICDLGPELAAWLAQQRERRTQRHRAELEGRADAAEHARDYDAALAHARELITLDPLSEAVHRRMIRVLYLQGDRAAALLAFDRCEQMLKDEVGARPSAETLALLATIDAAAPPLPPPPSAPPAAVLRPPRMVGRAAELRQLIAGWHSGEVVAIVGEAGMGKSRLLQDFAASHPGTVHVAARPGDAGVPLALLARLLREVSAVGERHGRSAPLDPAQRAEIARVLPEFDVVALPRAESVGQRLTLQRAVQSMLRAQAGLVGLLVDDLHFADEASLDMLRMLIDETTLPGQAPAPLHWALAYRPAEATSPLHALQDALTEQARLQPLMLKPLDEAQLAELVDSLGLPGVEGRTLAPALARRTGGNPLFVLETLKQAWVERSLDRLADDRRLPRPLSVGRLIERRIMQLSPAALTLARVASIAGVDFDIALAERVLGVSAMQLADALNELETAQVMRGNAFAHDLVFEAVQASVPSTVAARTHGQVAAWLEQQAGEPARVAEHWIAAGHAEAAIAPLREAAERSAKRTCFAEASRFLERAAQLCVQANRRAEEFEVLERLGYFYTFNDPGAPNDAVIERLLAIAQGEREGLRAQVALHDLRRRRQAHSQPTELASLLHAAQRIGDTESVSSLVTLLVGAHVQHSQPEAALELLQQHSSLFEARQSSADLADMQGNLSQIFANLDRFPQALACGQRAFALRRDSGDLADAMQVLCNLTRVYRMQGRMVRAQAAFEEIDRWHAAAAPNPRAWVGLRAPFSELHCDLDHLRVALEALEVEPDAALRAAGRVAAAWPIARAKLWLRLGQHTRARQALAAGLASAGDAPGWLRARWYLLHAQVAARVRGGGIADQPGDDAIELLDRASRLAPRDQRRSAWFECELQRAAWIEPTAGAALAEVLESLARQQGMMGYALHALHRVAERRMAGGLVDHAMAALREARGLRSWTFGDSEPPESVFPCGMSRAEAALIDARVSRAVNEPGANEALDAAIQDLRCVARDQVPEPFRDSFLHRNPVNRELLALAARWTAT